MKSVKSWRMVYLILFGVYFLLSSAAFAEIDNLPFSPGEKFRFTIYASGIRVGYQTIELQSTQEINGVEVYVLKGLTKTTPFVSILYRLDDKWTIYIDKNSLMPVRIEKDYHEGKRKGYYVYDINQEGNMVNMLNKQTGKEKQIISQNYVFDLFSLIYFTRGNPSVIKGTKFTFDFLQPKSVRTVHFQDAGDVEINVPRLSSKMVPVHKLEQIGGIGIDIYVGDDDLKLPLKMVVPAKLPKKKKVNMEFIITKYSPGEDQKNIPEVYNRIRW